MALAPPPINLSGKFLVPAASSAAIARLQQAPGRDAETLGPSDSSDSGSDVHGATRMKTSVEEGPQAGGATPIVEDSDTDAEGTGERAEAVPEGARDGADIASILAKDALDSAESITGNDDAIESLADDSENDEDDEDVAELLTSPASGLSASSASCPTSCRNRATSATTGQRRGRRSRPGGIWK